MTNLPRLAVVILLAFAAALVGARAEPAASPSVSRARADDFVRGMTLSCPGAGKIWGTDAMVQSMEKLKDLGVNWVTIHPYAGIRADGSVTMRGGLYDDTTWLTRPIAEAHRLGLKIMIKPHIAYWGSPFSWRAEIAFDTEEKWARFFETYERWITRVAELSMDADAFVVGTELGGTVHREAEWRRVIAAVRAKGGEMPLTYSGNWDRFEKVPFWDAVDVIGVQAYFPLVRHEGIPTEKELTASWRDLIRELDGVGRKHGKKIVLAELGYNRSEKAAREPWDYRQGGEQGEEVQCRCMAAALSSIHESESIVGAFLWKWFPGERQRSNFIMSTPAMQGVIREHWGVGQGEP